MSFQLSSSTLGSYITAVRDLLNQPNASNSFWSDAELTRYINEAIRMYYQEVSLNDEGFWTKSVPADITSGVETVPLPSDCFNVKAVYKLVAQGYVVLPYRNMESESYTTQGGTSPDTFFPSYYFREQNIVLRPVPNFSQTAGLQIEYWYMPTMLTDAGDTMTSNVLPIFKQLIEMYAVYKAKMKESIVNGVNTYQPAKDNLDQIYKLFVDTVRNRSKYPQFINPWQPESNW